jgi:hypothetical protein
MDEVGPLYTVGMSRGQGFNSYIQETRIDNAVKFILRPTTAQSNGLLKEPVPNSKAETVIAGNETKGTATVDDKSNDPQAFLMNLLTKWDRQRDPAPAAAQNAPKLPYRFNPSERAKANQHVVFSSREINKTSDIESTMGFNLSSAIKAGNIGPGAEVRGSITSDKELRESDLAYFLHVTVLNEHEEKDEDPEFQPIDGLKERLGEILKSGQSQSQAHQCAIEFTRIYGDCFISDFVKGGEMFAVVRIKTHDQSKKKEIGYYASASLTPMAAPVEVKAQADFNQKKEAAFKQAQTSIRIQWRGGGEIKEHDFTWGIDSLVQIANAFPSFVAETSANVRAVLTPYSSLKSFQKWQLSIATYPLTLSYEHCGHYTQTLFDDYNDYSELCEEICKMIREPDKYKPRAPAKGTSATASKNDPSQRAPTQTLPSSTPGIISTDTPATASKMTV